jgi:hypothetical protein
MQKSWTDGGNSTLPELMKPSKSGPLENLLDYTSSSEVSNKPLTLN